MSSQAKLPSETGVAEQLEIDQLAEAEVGKHQKQYRILENERVTFVESRNKESRKFERIVISLEKEKYDLQFQLEAEQCGTHSRKETEFERKLRGLKEKHAKEQLLLKKKKDNIWEIEGHIKKIFKEISQLRENEVTDTRYNESIYGAQKNVKKLENRLDVVNKRAGLVMAENASLRKTIDHMLQERATFNVMWEKLVNKLNEGKKYIMDLVEQATTAYDQREELCNKLQQLKEKGQSEKVIHVQEMRELQRKLDHDAKLQEFLGIKGQRRSNSELEEREATKKRKQQEELERQNQEYEQILTRIMKFSSEQDIDKLIAKFVKQEEENFALFNYVNELSHEVETLNDFVQALQDTINEQREINATKERSQDDNIELLQKEELIQKEKADTAYDHKFECDSKLVELLHAVEKIYKLLHCDEAPILHLLNNEKNVTLNNYKLFLGIIERKVQQIITNINYVEPTTKILGKKDRIPNFNVRESAKLKNN